MTTQALSINWDLNNAFFLGTPATPSTVPFKLPCAIAGHAYQIDFSKYRRTTLPIRRLSSDSSVEPGEATLNASGVWPRAQDNWFLGAGQKFLDNRFAFESVYVHSGEYPSVRTRFWKSQGIDPWQEGSISLHKAYQSIATSSSGMQLIVCGSYLYRTDGAHLYFVENPGTGSLTWTEVTTANTKDIVALATDGSRVWFACGSDGVYVTTAGSTTASAAATPAALTAPQGLLATSGTGTVNTTNLPASTSVTWKITAVDTFGNETNATSITETTASTPVPEDLSWNAQPAASSFNVYREVSSATVLIANVTSPSYVDDGSQAGSSQSPPASNQTGSTAYAATFLAYAKGHLVASTGRDLVEILASGSVSFIFEHENPSFTWTCACETPTAILVGGYAGGLSYIGSIQPDSATNGATLAPPIWATTLPPGEDINAIAYSAGSILMGTSEGIRSGTRPDASGVFDVNPAIADPGNCLCLAPYDRFEYFGWSNYDPTESWATRSTVSGLGRADLSQYTTSGVPAYATDVMSTTTGSVTAVAVLSGVPYFVVDDAGSYSLWGPTANYVASGWLEPGWVRYGTLEKKILVEIDFQCEALPDDTASVNFSVVNEFYVESDIGTLAGKNQTTVADPLYAGLTVGDRYLPIITLTAGVSDGTTPVLLSWISKSMVVPSRQDEILLPIILKEEVASLGPATQEVPYDTLNEFLFLKGLEKAGAPVTHTLGTDSHQVYIDQVQVGDVSTEMNNGRTWLNTLVLVKMLTLS